MSNDTSDTPSLSALIAENESEDQAVLAGLDKMDEEEKETEVKKEEAAEKEPEGEKKGSKKKEEFDKQELLEIFDTMMFEGEYREPVKLGRKYSVVFRTRTVKESNSITRKVDALNLTTIMAVQNTTNVLTLAYAIVEYNGVDKTKETLDKRIDFVESLPESVIVLLSDKLFKFDRKVLASMEEGHKNF